MSSFLHRFTLICGLVCCLSLTSQAQMYTRMVSEQAIHVKGFPAKVQDAKMLHDKLGAFRSRAMQEGYLLFSVDSIAQTLDSAIVYLFVGDRFELSKEAGLAQQSKYISAELDRLENQGYPFASVQVKRQLDSLIYTSVWMIEPGPYISIDSVVYLEEPKLPQKVLNRYLGLQKDEAYSEQELSTLDRRLRSLPFIRSVRPASVIFSQDKARLILSLEKRKADRLDGIVGLQPDAEGRTQFTGDLNLELHNALGHLDELRFNWQRVANNTQRLDIRVKYPHLFLSSVGIEGAIAQYRQDTTFNEVALRAGLFSYLEQGGSLTLFLESKIANDIQAAPAEDKLSSRALQYGLAFNYANLDDPYNPLRGSSAAVSFAYGDKDISGSEPSEAQSLEQWTARADLQHHVALGDKSTFLLRANAQHVQSDVLISKELYRIGGLHTLRGHDEQSIRASTYVIGTLEGRLLSSERSYFSAFVDYAYVRSDLLSADESDYPYGFGIGAALDTSAGILALSYALGSRYGNPIDLNTGKIHFGYTAVF